jgi:hypothetical protein
MGLPVSSLQAFLFGRPEMQLFGGGGEFVPFVETSLTLLSWLGGTHLVYGAPKQRRIPEGMDPKEAWDQAVKTFRHLGQVASNLGVFLSVEANPAVYGGNFILTNWEAVDFVCEVDSPGVRYHLDTGSLAEDPSGFNVDWLMLASTFHVSELGLAPFRGGEAHETLARRFNWEDVPRLAVLEMLPPPGGLEALKPVCLDFVSTYGR